VHLDPHALLPQGEGEVTPPRKAFMDQAIAAALAGLRAGEGGPFGALVARGDEVLGVACNRVLARKDPTAHAEVEAIRAACARIAHFRLEGCDLYATCEPCPMCLAAAYWSRIDRVFHACGRGDAARAGFDDALVYRELELPPGDRHLPLLPFEREAGLATFEAWSRMPNRTLY
jgi:guanine deaminase